METKGVIEKIIPQCTVFYETLSSSTRLQRRRKRRTWTPGIDIPRGTVGQWDNLAALKYGKDSTSIKHIYCMLLYYTFMVKYLHYQ